MLSANNILSPAHGRPLVTPTQDMIIGAYYLTELVEGDLGEGRVFGSVAEALQAYEAGDISLHAKISLRDTSDDTEGSRRDGTLGRFLFDECLPAGFGYITETVKKKQMGEIVDRLPTTTPRPRWPPASTASRTCASASPPGPASPSPSPTSRPPPRSAGSSTTTRRRPTRSSSSSGRASSPTVSGARRRWRSGPTPPTRCGRRWSGVSPPSSSTPST
jgi:hypothetical protein